MIGSYVLHQGAGELYQTLVSAMRGYEKGNNYEICIDLGNANVLSYFSHHTNINQSMTKITAVVLLFITQCYNF